MKRILLQIMSIIAIICLLSRCKSCKKTVESPLSLRELSDRIIAAFNSGDMDEVANHVDAQAGLLFSPYIYVQDDAVVFDKNEVASMLESNQVYHWGEYSDIGGSIELTPREYIAEFLDMNIYQNPDEVVENDVIIRGSTINNIREKFPNAQFIEYYVSGTEQYAGMDWAGLYLVYNRADSGHLKLIAIVRDSSSV